MDGLNHPALAPYRAAILAALRPTAEFTLEPCAQTAPRQSKIGGLPYLPRDTAYPLNRYGRPLTLLVQINFAEMPPLPDFPDSGILQWFIDTHGFFNLWGADLQNPLNQDGFRVLYHAEVSADDAALVQDFSFLDGIPPVPPPKLSLWQRIKGRVMDGESRPPFKRPCAIRFRPGSQLPGYQDCTLHLCGEGVPDITYDNYEFDDGAACDAYAELTDCYDDGDCYNGGHRIGGYPFFTQEDPRTLAPEYREYVQLIQLDSDSHVMWGDAGAGHLFIRPQDLRRRDFSRTMYTWDCA
ncbi:MAG: DUF1963 domain-containing protein [Neisseria sp.]|nr:DUF1963 domain-containing protein [Neisseria sp.]